MASTLVDSSVCSKNRFAKYVFQSNSVIIVCLLCSTDTFSVKKTHSVHVIITVFGHRSLKNKSTIVILWLSHVSISISLKHRAQLTPNKWYTASPEAGKQLKSDLKRIVWSHLSICTCCLGVFTLSSDVLFYWVLFCVCLSPKEWSHPAEKRSGSAEAASSGS